MPDLKIALFGVESGQDVMLTVLRKRVFFGPRQMEFKITIP